MSSSNSAFNLQGAIKPNPKAPNPISLGQSLGGGNPLTRVLNSMKIGGQSTPMTIAPAPQTMIPTSQPQAKPQSSAPAPQQQQNSGVLKSRVTETYHAPAQQQQTGYAQTDPTRIINNTTGQQANGVTPQPITGNATTPSGAVVNSQTGATVSAPNTGSAFSGLLGNLKDSAMSNQAIGQDAKNIAARYGAQIADVGQKGVKAQAGYLTTGTTPVAEGNSAVIAQTTAAQQQALTQGLEAELQGTGQQLTANSQTATALANAGNLAQPTQVPYNNQFIDPTTGLPINPNAGADMASAVALQAQKLRAGTTSPQDAANALSAYGQAGTNALQQALGAQFSIPQATGNAQAQQANAQTGGTASVEANKAIYNEALANSANLQQQLSNVDQLGTLLLTTAQQGGINPSNSQFANQSIAQVRAQLSNPQQASFDSTMQTLTSKIGLLLNVGGGVVTDQVRDSANQVLSGTLALSALPSVLAQIAAEGDIVANNQRDVAVKAYQNIIQGNQTGGGQQSSGGGSVSAGGYNFVQDANGNWIPAK